MPKDPNRSPAPSSDSNHEDDFSGNQSFPDDPLPGFDLTAPVSRQAVSNDAGHSLPSIPDKYQLIRQLGQGGMGEIYLAEQSVPIRRQVAIKVIRSGKNSQEMIARFDAERQSLALMSHPNIATVFDAGLTSDGNQFFAMEYVSGTPLDEFCRTHQLSIENRLRLFITICDGVSHAHQKGIIHRDLKPGNILVEMTESGPRAKIIDFGLAKATDQSKISEETISTELGQIVGTVRYLSPEQAGLNSIDIDTRSDIYSLGVILYELLIGDTPLDGDSIRTKGILETLQVIRNSDPMPLTARLRTSQPNLEQVCRERQVTEARLQQLIRGDLECIVMKALSVDRQLRYQTASQFADDARQFLSGEPILARPASTLYRFRKFVGRNPVFSATVATLVLALLATVGISVTLAIWANREATQAKQARIAAEKSETEANLQRRKAEQETAFANQARQAAEAAENDANRQRLVAEQARQKTEESRKRALSALGKIREFAFARFLRAKNSVNEVLIDVILNEYGYWSEKSPDSPLVMEHLNALIQLAELKVDLGEFVSAKSVLAEAQKRADSMKVAAGPDLEIARIRSQLLDAIIRFRESSDYPGGEKYDANQETLVLELLGKLERFPKQEMSAPTLVAACQLLEKLGWQLYQVVSPHAFQVANKTREFAAEGKRRFPENREFDFQEAFALNRMGLYLYKKGRRTDSDAAEFADRIGQLFDDSITRVGELIDSNYRPIACREKLVGYCSNRGMYLLSCWRGNLITKEAVVQSYDYPIQVFEALLEKFPGNYAFKSTFGVLLLNKADALFAFEMLEQEEKVRYQAVAMLKDAVEVMTPQSLAGERLDLVQTRLIRNQLMLGKRKDAIRIAVDLYSRNPGYSGADNSSLLSYKILVLQEGNLTENEADSMRSQVVELMRQCVDKYSALAPKEQKFLRESMELASFRNLPEFRDFWNSLKND